MKVSIKNTPRFLAENVCNYWQLLKNPKIEIIEEFMPPNSSVKRHLHKNSDQFFYCLEGELLLEINDTQYILFSAEGVFIEAGHAHKAATENLPARFLVISVPDAHGDRIDLE